MTIETIFYTTITAFKVIGYCIHTFIYSASCLHYNCFHSTVTAVEVIDWNIGIRELSALV